MLSIMQFSEKISRLIIRRKCCIMNLNMISEVFSVEVSVGDRVEMKKPHPCGGREFEILRVGMDFKIKCLTCGREVMAPRRKLEKNIKRVIGE